jgi:hypothetical protein
LPYFLQIQSSKHIAVNGFVLGVTHRCGEGELTYLN